MTKKKRERQQASTPSARHSSEGRNPELALNLPEPPEGDEANDSAIGTVPLKCVTSKIADGSHNPPPKQTSGVPMLSARNISEIGIAFDDFRFITREAFELECKRVNLLPGDVLLTIVGSIGRAAVVPESPRQFAIQRSVAMIRPRGLDSKFCMYQLRSDRVQKWLREHARGSAQQGVYLKTLANLPMVVVPLARQRQIVAEIEKQFTRLDAGVAALRRVQANLKRYRAAVLKAACEGRLVPTEADLARAEGRTYETGEQLLARILVDRRKNWHGRGKYKEPAASDTTNLPPLPEGWAVASIDQLADETTMGLDRGRGQQSSDPSFGVPYIKMNNVTMDGSVHYDKLVYVPASHEETTRFAVKDDDILFNTRNSKELVGKVGRVRAPPAGAIYNNNLMRIRLVAGIESAFITIQMCSHEFRRRMELVKKATTNVAAVYAKDLLPLAVVVPPRVEQTRIVAEVERRLSVIEELETAAATNLKRVTRLRQSILQKAFVATT